MAITNLFFVSLGGDSGRPRRSRDLFRGRRSLQGTVCCRPWGRGGARRGHRGGQEWGVVRQARGQGGGAVASVTIIIKKYVAKKKSKIKT